MRILNRLVPVVLLAAVVFFVRAPFMIDGVRYESTMGLIQKIFYFHVPAAMTTFVSAFVCGIASVIYLVRRRPLADHVALAAAELAVVFGLIVLVTGPIWARKACGVWWQWEARLMATLIMWMIFVAYLLLRRFGGAGAEVLAAAVGLSATPCWKRVKDMEAAGVIRGYSATVDRESVGLALCVLAEVNLTQHTENTVREFERAVAACPQIVSCHSTTGAADYSIMVLVEDIKSYEAFLHDTAFKLPGVTHIRSSVVLKEVKAAAGVPIAGAARAARPARKARVRA